MTKDEALRLALEALIEVRDANIRGLTLTQHYHEAITAIKAALEAKDEPVAEVTSETGADITMSWWHEPALPMGTKLYTTPPQPTWVKLTNEQYLEACKMAEGGNYMVAFQRIQQWLKEKNT